MNPRRSPRLCGRHSRLCFQALRHRLKEMCAGKQDSNKPQCDGAGRLPLPPPQRLGAGVAVGAALAAGCHFSFRISSFQIALACSSEPLNGLSVPRNLRYAVFVVTLDMFHLRTGGAVLSESYGELSSGRLARIPVRSVSIISSPPLRVNGKFRMRKSKITRSRRVPPRNMPLPSLSTCLVGPENVEDPPQTRIPARGFYFIVSLTPRSGRASSLGEESRSSCEGMLTPAGPIAHVGVLHDSGNQG